MALSGGEAGCSVTRLSRDPSLSFFVEEGLEDPRQAALCHERRGGDSTDGRTREADDQEGAYRSAAPAAE